MSVPEMPEVVEPSPWPEDLRRTGLPQPVRDVVPREVPAGRSEFRGDLTRAFEVWRAQPALPLMTTAYASLSALGASGSAGATIGGIAALVFLGWVGSERLWYLRAFTGRRLSVAQALRSSFHYWGRFFALGLLVTLLSIPLMLPALPAMAQTARAGGGEPHYGVWLLVYLAATSLVVDFALTFVTPAIVYTSKRARDAVAIGFTLLRRTWPATVPYVLLPPLAALLLTRLSDGPLGWFGAAVYVAASLVNLLAKGATAAYYLRVVPAAGPDGDNDETIGWARDGWYR